jgi:hypothetical protein
VARFDKMQRSKMNSAHRNIDHTQFAQDQPQETGEVRPRIRNREPSGLPQWKKM